MTRILRDLSELPSLRVVLATRALTVGGEQIRYQSGGQLFELMARSANSVNLIDLDNDRYFDLAGMANYAAALLTQTSADTSRLPDAAWARYRADPALSERLGAAVAARAQPNHLATAFAADELSMRPEPVDPAAPDLDPTDIPTSVRETVDKYLTGLKDRDPDLAEQVSWLLTALAYARGVGIDNHLWQAFAHALGCEQVRDPDLQQLRHSPAADYLLQTVPTGGGAPVTRLFHQAFADELLYRRALDGYLRRDDEAAILTTLRPTRDGWANGQRIRANPRRRTRRRGRSTRPTPRRPELPDYRRSGPAGAAARRRTIRPGPGRRHRPPAKRPPPRPPRPACAGQPAQTDRPPARLPQPGRLHRERRPRPAVADRLVPRPPGRWPPGPHWPHPRGGRGVGRGAAGRDPGHRQRRPRLHGAGVAAGRRQTARAAAAPTRIGTGCRRSRQCHRHCGRGRHSRPPASAPATHALTVVC